MSAFEVIEGGKGKDMPDDEPKQGDPPETEPQQAESDHFSGMKEEPSPKELLLGLKPHHPTDDSDVADNDALLSRKTKESEK